MLHTVVESVDQGTWLAGMKLPIINFQSKVLFETAGSQTLGEITLIMDRL
jgi:hypothetical protein